MNRHPSNLSRIVLFGFTLLLALTWFGIPARAQQVILHLTNGDRLAGRIVSEDTNRIVIATEWIKELPVPLSAIKQREDLRPPAPATNTVAALKPSAAQPPIKPAPPKRWKANVTLGTDLQFGARDRQLYYTRFKLTYERPYKNAPKKFFRSLFDFAVDYGETEGIVSANRAEGSVKTDFDVGTKRWYLYNLGGAGYDDIRKVDLHYEEGPGIGYHLFATEKFIANLEAGANYQVQEREDSSNSESFFLRFAEDVTWKLGPKLVWIQKFEFTPRVEDVARYRFRFDSTLSFPIWKNLSVNLSVLDLYDTSPANGVNQNELLVRSTLGISF
jgi:hypothetical protein